MQCEIKGDVKMSESDAGILLFFVVLWFNNPALDKIGQICKINDAL